MPPYAYPQYAIRIASFDRLLMREAQGRTPSDYNTEKNLCKQ